MKTYPCEIKKIDCKNITNSIYIFSEYYKTPTGEKCPIPQMINSESKCKEAAEKLGLQWISSYDYKAKFPPGCFFADDGKGSGVVFFNRVDAEGPMDMYRGLCLAQGECYGKHM